MYEIELKAWLDDKPKAVEHLSKAARYDGVHDKADTYWSMLQSNADSTGDKSGRRITIRIRKETITKNTEDQDSDSKTIYLVTYKHHTKSTTETGEVCEVNDEKEFELLTEEAAESFSTFLYDAGFRVSLEKHKVAEGWYIGDYHIELCNVEKLGDFFEIETLAPDNKPETVAQRKKGLLEIIDMCGIPRERVEERYYREMLEEIERNGTL